MPSTGKEKAALTAAAAADHPPVPAGPLEDIFLRLDAADLARASAACTTFRGLIKDADFRRRFARLHHPPPLVALLDDEEFVDFHPRRALHTGRVHQVYTPAARAVAEAADLTCSFVPDPGSWRIRDASSGRLLLSSHAATDFDLMVCDPLHRTFVRLPPVPDHLTNDGKRKLRSDSESCPFLVPLPVPAAAGEEDKEPPLQVVWMLPGRKAMRAFVFSSSTWKWSQIPRFCASRREYPLSAECYRLYAHGCFYWTSCHFRSSDSKTLSHTALKLDMRNMEFSTMKLPSVKEPLVILEAGEGKLSALVVGSHSLDLYCRTMEEGSGVGAAADWRHSRTVPLPNDSHDYSIVGAGDGYLLLHAYPELICFSRRTPRARYFSVKLKTLVFEQLSVWPNKGLMFAHLYTNFPAPLSLPMPSVSNEQKTGQDEGVAGEASATVPDGDSSRTVDLLPDGDGSRTISSAS